MNDHRHNHPLVVPNPIDDRAVLAKKHHSTDHQDQAELAKGGVVFFDHSGIEFAANDGKSDHDAEMHQFADTFEQ